MLGICKEQLWGTGEVIEVRDLVLRKGRTKLSPLHFSLNQRGLPLGYWLAQYETKTGMLW